MQRITMSNEEADGWVVVYALMREWEVDVVELSDRELITADLRKLRVERMYDKAGVRIVRTG